jgi:hypothetical protein
MQTYLTEARRPEGTYVGPEIAARSWEEAEARVAELGVTLVGELQYVTDSEGVVTRDEQR